MSILACLPADPHRQPRYPHAPALPKNPPKIAFPMEAFVPTETLIHLSLWGEPPAPLLPAVFDHPASARRLHLGSKSVHFSAMAHIRLIGSFWHCGGIILQVDGAV